MLHYTRPAVSKLIKILYGAGFISISDVGRERRCSLNQKGFHDLQQWIDYYEQFWQIRMKKIEDLIVKQTKRTRK